LTQCARELCNNEPLQNGHFYKIMKAIIVSRA
jgi:hypothetical protein